MEKLLIYDPEDKYGRHFFRSDEIFGQEKVADDYEWSPEVKDIVSKIKPDPKYVTVLLNAMGAGEYYGCFPPNTKVLDANWDERNIEELAKNKFVIASKGQEQNINETFSKDYSGTVRTLKFTSSINSLTCTENHPVLRISKDKFFKLKRKHIFYPDNEEKRSTPLHERRSEFTEIARESAEYTKAENLEVGDYCVSLFDNSVKECDEIKSLDMAKILGWYAAEGCVYDYTYKRKENPRWKDRHRQGVIFTLGGKEYNLAKDLSKSLSNEGIKNNFYKYKGSCTRVEARGERIKDLCLKHVGKYSHGKRLSKELLRMPKGWQIEFLKAYFQGDGSIVTSKRKKKRYVGTLRATSVSIDLAKNTQKLLWRIGIPASLCKRLNKSGLSEIYNTKCYIYEVNIGSYYSNMLTENTRFDTFNKNTTTSGIFVGNGFTLLRIRSIKNSSYNGPVYNLSVSNDQSYTANSMVVHNSNNRGDFFRETELIDSYNTFEHIAHVFKFHDNKDPKKAFGKVTASIYNPRMHRIELVIKVDREKAPDIAEKIDKGEFPNVSMGAKVQKDICSICGKENKTIADYCEELKNHMNEILADGRQVYADNIKPRFFDISFVPVGADRTARVLRKVASANVPSAMLMEAYKNVDKRKSAKLAATFNWGKLEMYEKPLVTPSKLDKDAMWQLVSSYIKLGIMPNLKEFCGLAKRAGLEENDSIDLDLVSEVEFPKMAMLMPGRSAFSPYLENRLVDAASKYAIDPNGARISLISKGGTFLIKRDPESPWSGIREKSAGYERLKADEVVYANMFSKFSDDAFEYLSDKVDEVGLSYVSYRISPDMDKSSLNPQDQLGMEKFASSLGDEAILSDLNEPYKREVVCRIGTML